MPVFTARTKYALNDWLHQAGPIFDASLALEFFGFTGPQARQGLVSFQGKRPPSFSQNTPVRGACPVSRLCNEDSPKWPFERSRSLAPATWARWQGEFACAGVASRRQPPDRSSTAVTISSGTA